MMYVLQIRAALDWIHAALSGQLTYVQAGMSKNTLFRVQPARFTIQTDACPHGFGGLLLKHGQIIEYFADVPSRFDLTLLGATVEDPGKRNGSFTLFLWR
eukprot:5139032-Amphidinium_carterae.2